MYIKDLIQFLLVVQSTMLRQVERVKFWFVGFFSPDFTNRSQFASKRKHGAIRR